MSRVSQGNLRALIAPQRPRAPEIPLKTSVSSVPPWFDNVPVAPNPPPRTMAAIHTGASAA